MTKFECAEKIVDTLNAEQIRKLAAKQVAQLMKQSRYNPNAPNPRELINAAFDGIQKLDKVTIDFAQAWYDHNQKQYRI